jgi:hypothetical protein
MGGGVRENMIGSFVTEGSSHFGIVPGRYCKRCAYFKPASLKPFPNKARNNIERNLR